MNNKKNKNNGHSSNGNGNGNGFVATIEPTNGNGNGHKKAEVKEQPKPVETTIEDSIKITPHFNRLSTKGVEMFKNMGEIENAKLFLDDLVMETGNDHTTIACLMVLLQAIREKSEKGDFSDHPVDYISALQNHLFSWTWEFDKSSESYIEAVKTGNFVVDELIDSDSGETATQPAAKEIKYSPKKEASNVVEPKAELEGKPFYGRTYGDYIHKDCLAELIDAILNNEDMPPRFWNTVFDSLNDMNSEPLLIMPSVQEIGSAINRENCRGLQIKRQTEEIKETNDADCVVSLANKINDIFYDDNLPHTLCNELCDGIFGTARGCGIDNDVNVSAEFVEEVIREYWKQREGEKEQSVPDINPPQQSEPSFSEQLAQHQLQIMANQFCHILQSDKVSNDTKDAFISILLEAGSEAGMAVQDPELIKIAFPKIINSLEFNYGKGIVLALNALLDSFLGTPVGDELNQYAKRFESETSLAESPEPSEDSTNDLAFHLSAVLNNPDTPKSIFNALSDELSTFECDVLSKICKTPEFIREALETAAA
jgi:hypothetical protein